MIRNTKHVSVDDIQDYMTKGATVHPVLYAMFLELLVQMEYERRLCILPEFRAEIYSKRVAANIARKLAA